MSKIKLSMPNLGDARMRKQKNTITYTYRLDETYKNEGQGKTYYIYTYGCQGNEADSEVISGILEDLGYTLATSGEDSDLVILNTCAIRENAENRIWGVLGNLKGIKAKRPNMLIGICGCMPQEENATNKLITSYPFVDLIFGTHNIYDLPKLLHEAYSKESKVIEVISTEGDIYEGAPKHRALNHKAWVNIMFGCDEFCTYCIVPYTRGKERSRAKEDIINEVKELVKKGYKEVTLLGQNVNAYGKDLGIDYTFGDLLYDLDKTGIARIRFTTSHPKDLDLKTIYAMRDCKSVMPQLHLPVQSGDDHILKKMNRKYTHQEYLDKIAILKKEIPNISLTTDIIVGFPNETEEEFNNTLKLVDEVKFEGAFTFIYSKREGTPAARMEDNVSLEEKHRRLDKLNELVDKYYLEGNKRFEGKIFYVLVDGVSKNNKDNLCGYSENLKLVHFPSKDLSLIGQIVPVKIIEGKTWFALGELVSE